MGLKLNKFIVLTITTYLMFVMMAICRNADTLKSPKQNAKEIFSISVKRKAAQKGRGPRIAREMLPKETETTINRTAIV